MDVDDLYALPPADFTPARDALAKELKAAGDKDAAAEVKALRRPTVAAWALNLAARRAPDELREAILAGDTLRAAHGALMGGKADPHEVRRASEEERTAAAALASAAARLAEEAGTPLSPTVKDRVRETIHAASLDEAARNLLAAGRLEKELAPSGGLFGGGFAGGTPAPRKPRATRPEKPGPRSRKSSPETRGKRAKVGASGAPQKSKTQREAARRALAAAERELRKCEGGAEAARIRLADTETALAQARARLERAEADHADALTRHERASTELRAAKEAVARAAEEADL
jgi:hypothetical protein